MTEKPEAWWRPPPEHEGRTEQNRLKFKAQFGSFEAVEFDSYWIGTSMDGKYLAFQFHRPDGSIHRFALPDTMAQQFLTEIMGTIEEMGKRQLVAVEIKGEA
ncbi:hypothetical protein [Mesorhizobium sp.]|uniref:hypothetical protein n=1 Tax=Mesorhizobium sp. TaxID=1871066 RepID=UPI000FEA3B2D|nr:hypothetical protein [Mesorhizobium sp.]RWH32216.1 MAG: hypothetical protein EOQ76_03740 [Mesorhizobium sp.]RWH40842.1 MAG: hypothetical protein EOQ79_02685 [Mesorhizobium sp.]TIM65485.1 MAG: hypothetical protein E5Y52_16895 [Mesorhizobium sp.]TIQ11004.1 MAG: hypothetical protein E5X50_09450 [Mesorhizobium sp.]TIR61465.1 MAG: hypothetical protein E5X22_04705 [Mesorhizobium sp.]